MVMLLWGCEACIVAAQIKLEAKAQPKRHFALELCPLAATLSTDF
jgi:hypothetical protein